MPTSSPGSLEELLRAFPREEKEELVAVRRDLHRHPELEFEETRTAGVVSRKLAALGIPFRTGVGRTGVVADWPAGGAPRAAKILLRADMDALPVQEES